jgi:hypothetical protein
VDRLVLYPIAPEHIETVNLYVKLIECKAPGKKPEPHQIREHERLLKMGYIVEVVDKK